MSHWARSQIASASSPLVAVMTSKYSAESRASSNFTLAGTSSTTRTRAVMRPLPSGIPQKVTDRFDELSDRDRLRQIGLTSALADALFVALHGKGGDRDDRDGAQFVVFLEPLGDLEAGDLGELDIHQDQIGMMLAGEIERLD